MAALANARAAELDQRIAEIERDALAREKAAASIVQGRLQLAPRTSNTDEWPTFESWAKQKALRSLPAKPAVVAMFALDRGPALGLPKLLVVLESVSHVHEAQGLSDPAASPV